MKQITKQQIENDFEEFAFAFCLIFVVGLAALSFAGAL